MKPTTVRELWSSFEEVMVPPGAETVQRTETKLAFYAGAGAVLAGMRKMVETGVPDVTAAKAVEGWFDECNEFIQDFAKDPPPPIYEVVVLVAPTHDCDLAKGYAICRKCGGSSYSENDLKRH